MKKLVILSILAILLTSVNGYAEESTQTVNDNKAVVAVQKQPSKDSKQTAKNNWFSIVIQVNGKINDSVSPESAR